MTICVVIPTFNENKTIGELIRRLQNSDFKIDQIIVVDDGSIDGTLKTLQRLQNRYQNITVIERGFKLGFGSAVRKGLEFAYEYESRFKRFIQMDADLSHDPKWIKNMLVKNVDVVVGSRYIKGGGTKGWSRTRKITSVTACFLARSLLKLPVKDCTSGFKIYSRKAISKILRESRENKSMGTFEVETILIAKKRNLTTIEVPIIFQEREGGMSKFGVHEIINMISFILSRLFW